MQITEEDLKRRLGKNLLTKLDRHLGDAVASEASESEKKPSNKGNDSENKLNAGRGADPNAPKSLRVVAGILAKADNGVIAAQNISQVIDAKFTNEQARYAAKQNNKITEKEVEEIALTRLMDALGLLTIDSMIGEKPKDLSIIASNLSRVHKNLKPDAAASGAAAQVQVTIYAPQQRSIQDYEVLEVTGT